ncbi:unclassified [Brachyspira pilosicoli]|nr:unclassified [Brachyspira pilosicoli]
MDLVKKYLDDHKIDFNMVTESVIAIWHNDTFF